MFTNGVNREEIIVIVSIPIMVELVVLL
ncbi:hypothetical protein LINGRAPRIM_LOCUS1431 [Linum grandiflorum]